MIWVIDSGSGRHEFRRCGSKARLLWVYLKGTKKTAGDGPAVSGGIKKAERVSSGLSLFNCLFSNLLAWPPQKRMGTRIPLEVMKDAWQVLMPISTTRPNVALDLATRWAFWMG